jgi:molybdate transport system ATP-binding protein
MNLDFDVACKLGDFLYEAQFEVDDEILVLFGHSGAGKSLSLQFIAGLMRPDRGRIELEGTTLFDSATGANLPPQARRVGYVVQELALFEHLTVEGNVSFGLPRGADKASRTRELLSLLDLEGFENRKPKTLSGGQRQRVALARALAREAPLLLLDEPFSALDDSLRVSMRKELLRLRKQLGLTILFVTHDLREAHFLADRIAVFDNGRILQLDDRGTIFKRPASRRVAELTGTSNIFSATVVATVSDGLFLEVDGLRLQADGLDGRFVPGTRVDAAIRADRINLRRGGEVRNGLLAVVSEEFAFGNNHTLHLTPVGAGPAVEVEIASRPYEVLGVKVGQEWLIEIPPGDLHVMPAE